jgi:methanogenic corrinoid protein MtbC1
MKDILERLRESIYEGDEIESEKLAREALSKGIAAQKIVEEGLRPGLTRLGEEYESGEVALPELALAGDAALVVTQTLEEALKEGEEIPVEGTIAVGTVQGDIHSIGKSLVVAMMRAVGYRAIDLGVDVGPEEFLEAASKVDVIGLSTFISISIAYIENTVQQITSTYPDVAVIIGGAAATPALAEKLGVLYAADAFETSKVIEEELKGRRQ